VTEIRRRILIIGMADSVHLARWLAQFSEQKIDFVVFPSSPHRHIHPILKNLMSATNSEMTVRILPAAMHWLAFPLSALDIPFKNFFRARLLRSLIRDNQFDLIHVLELQHAGYLLLDAKLDHRFPKVFITNWGSDIYWFQKFPRHNERIQQLINLASYYSAECQRDIEMVRNYGFRGITMPVIPNAGGIDFAELQGGFQLTSQRTKIMIKGYTGFVGKALIALKACEIMSEQLKDYELVIYSASIKTRLKAMQLRNRFNLQITILKKRTPHKEILQQFLMARIYLGISQSDGISTSLLESMACGCFPIQTNTSCANEWITDKSTGFLVDVWSPNSIAQAIDESLRDSVLVNTAATKNYQTIKERCSIEVVKAKAVKFYDSMIF
jgi:glycosyltransferase involved in cell wall biosynthesis